MRKLYEIPTIEKCSFKLSDPTLCDMVATSSVTNDGNGGNSTKTKMTENQVSPMTE